MHMLTHNHTTTPTQTNQQSQQKKNGTAAFKTLDSVIQTQNRDTGKKEAVTYRCADINSLVPQIMGVSKVRAGCVGFGECSGWVWLLVVCRWHWRNAAGLTSGDACVRACMAVALFRRLGPPGLRLE
jgi:hypothetical protein